MKPKSTGLEEQSRRSIERRGGPFRGNPAAFREKSGTDFVTPTFATLGELVPAEALGRILRCVGGNKVVLVCGGDESSYHSIQEIKRM